MDSRKLLSKNLKKPNTTDLERDQQRPTLRRSTTDRRPIDGGGCDRPPQVDRVVFFRFLHRRLTTLDLRFLL